MQSYDLPGSTNALEQEDEGGDMSAAALEGRAKELMAEEGYLDGTLKETNPGKYARVQREITDLFESVGKRRTEQAVVDAEQIEAEAEAAREAAHDVLVAEVEREMVLINQTVKDGEDDVETPDCKNITQGEVNVLRMERLVRQGNYGEFLPLIQSEGLRLGETPYPQQVIDVFLAMDDETRLEHALVEIRKVLQAGREQSRVEKEWHNLGETE